MPVILRETAPIASLPLASLRERIIDLNADADTLGGVVFPGVEGNEEHVLVIFGGYLERFYMLSVARYATCKVVYLQDDVSRWYQGSDLLPSVEALCGGLLREEIAGARPTFFGQSSGGYACHYAASRFESSSAVACSPQTFSDRALKKKLILSKGIALYETPDDLIDLREQWRGAGPAGRFAAIVASASEQDNEANKYWLDHLHCLRMADVPEIHIFLRGTHVHAHVHRHAEAFARLLVALQAADAQTDIVRRTIVSDALNAMESAD